LNHFEAMLFSEYQNQRHTALFYAFFFPFSEIESILLRFIAIEEDPELVKKAARLFIINPSPSGAAKLVALLDAISPEKKPEIRDTLNGVSVFLSRSGLISKPPEEILANLTEGFRRHKIREIIKRCGQFLESPEPAHRLAAVQKLVELADQGIQPALEVLNGLDGRTLDPEAE